MRDEEVRVLLRLGPSSDVMRDREVVEELVTRHAVDLVVLGNVGLGEVSGDALTVPRALAASAPTDLLLVHTRGGEDGSPQAYARVVVGVDRTHRSFVAVRRAAIAAQGAGAALVLVHVGEDQEVLGRAAEIAAEEGVVVEELLTQGDPVDVLTTCARANGPCLIVVGNAGVDDASLDDVSVPARVINRAACDVLLVKTA